MTGKEGLTFRDLLVALKPVARICLSDTKTHPTGVSLHWRACSAWCVYCQYITSFFRYGNRFVYLFTSSRARRMYEVFKETSPNESCADVEVFSSMLESVFVHLVHGGLYVLISHCRY